MNHRMTFLTVLLLASGDSSSLFAQDQKLVQARIEHLRQMSEIERARFHRNLEAFQHLSPAEKHQYQQLHQQLAADQSRGGTLTQLMQTYAAWVHTLTPTQRDELQKETVLSQKLALIRRWKDEQDLPSDAHEPPVGTTPPAQTTPTADESHPPIGPSLNKRDAFPLKDLRSVLAVLVSQIPQDSSKPEFKEPRLPDYLPIIHASIQASGNSYRDWPQETLLNEMSKSLGKESAAQVNRSDLKSKREVMVRMLLMAIVKQAREAVGFPTDEDKMRLLQEMVPEEQNRILNFPADRMNVYLVRRWMESKGGDTLNDFRKIPEYNRQVDELFQRLDIIPPQKFLLKGRKPNDRPLKPRG